MTPFIRKSIMAIDALAYFPPHSNLGHVSATFVLSSDFFDSPDKVGPVEGRWRHPILAFPLVRGRHLLALRERGRAKGKSRPTL